MENSSYITEQFYENLCNSIDRSEEFVYATQPTTQARKNLMERLVLRAKSDRKLEARGIFRRELYTKK